MTAGGTTILISIHALLAESDTTDSQPLLSGSYFYPRSPCGERLDVVIAHTLLHDISIHALLAESDHFPGLQTITRAYFYPRSPCGERRGTASSRKRSLHFYPRSPCGERRSLFALHPNDWHFYPRSPCGERPAGTSLPNQSGLFLSTLSLRRATVLSLPFGAVWIISIHALLAESDGAAIGHRLRDNDFYPRSPCGERRRPAKSGLGRPIFLSTLSLRRATYLPNREKRIFGISIHALLAESDAKVPEDQYTALSISIHALLAESDASVGSSAYCRRGFLSTLSLRRATIRSHQACARKRDFYPRSPCGERRNTG